ncbi:MULTISPECIES: NAD(P)/FAD-dependent oxidoreductase [unclassified Helicobacter]|uniref:NAD(P)/FAD-dependent oxidoreductase n=1 Tax=unclassified Helicobacter TaxID=2593540 RepID=UPI000CF177C4|nr:MULTISPECIES: NAD(P)/FAD-dependent oxidoreductase [unclassified Helicobacter]
MKNILVLGAGYASLSFLKKINPKIFDFAQVTLISKYDYHYVSIALHDVVAGMVEDNSVKFPIKDIIPGSVHFVQDEVVEIQEKQVICKKQEYVYDYLIVGLGFQSDDFGISGVKEYCTPILDFANAFLLRDQILEQIYQYKTTGDMNNLKFVVCGGGLSGVEMISSLAIKLKKVCAQEGIDFGLLDLYCIEAMPNILPMFPDTLSMKAQVFLESHNVKVLTKCKILRCEKNKIIVENSTSEERSIEANTIIWTAGVRGNAVIEKSNLFNSVRSRVEVNDYLQPIAQDHQELMDKIYVIGDCCMVKNTKTNTFYPPTAQIAIKQGEYLGKALSDRLMGIYVEKFSFTPQGVICSLGDKFAVGLIKDREISGVVASTLKKAIEKKWIIKLFGLKGLFK